MLCRIRSVATTDSENRWTMLFFTFALGELAIVCLFMKNKHKSAEGSKITLHE